MRAYELQEAKQPSSSTDSAGNAKGVKDLAKFWGQGRDRNVGFAGPAIPGAGGLSKNEAQAALQRLLAAGRAVDFDEVRRLRKITKDLK